MKSKWTSSTEEYTEEVVTEGRRLPCVVRPEAALHLKFVHFDFVSICWESFLHDSIIIRLFRLLI